jgi:cellulose synthase operon protein YhjU
MHKVRSWITAIQIEHKYFAYWNFFFLLTILLYLIGAIRMDPVLNIGFLLWLLLPMPAALHRYCSLRYARQGINVLLAILLLWRQTWLPSPFQVLTLIQTYGLPSWDYMMTFITGVLTMPALFSLLTLALLGFLLSRRKLLNLVALPVLLVLSPHITIGTDDNNEPYSLVGVNTAEAADIDPERYLQGFYAAEAEQSVHFSLPAADDVPFDIVVIHACSLSWDDLKEIGITYDSPFFKQFDYLFTNFNSATGYSTPAVRRLLQSSCGQRSHQDIHHDQQPQACLLFNGLGSVGYKTFVGLSHDGLYGNFIGTIKQHTPSDTVILPLSDMKKQAIFFDGKTDLYNDNDVLKRWVMARESSSQERAALYYNSVLLHAGTRWVGERKSRNDKAQYNDVATAFLDDIQAFIDSLEASERNTVLLFVPEHGRALSGSRFQPADIRDIPLPKITKVPVGVKLIGKNLTPQETRQNIISKPTSYQALSWLMSRYVEKSPFGDNPPSADALSFRIPRTEFVAEHEGRVVMEMEGKFLYRHTDGKWITLTAGQLQ